MFTNIPVVIGMSGSMVDRGSNYVTMEVTGYKIRDCELEVDKFAGFYHDGSGGGTREAGAVYFPYDRIPGNSRPRGLLTNYNFGLFTIQGIPEEAIDVSVSSEHLCTIDGVVVRVTSTSGDWDITGEPDTDLLNDYRKSFKAFNAFNLPEPN